MLNISFSIYIITEFYEAYNLFKELYMPSGTVPVLSILSGIEQTVTAYIIITIINLISLLFVITILKKYIKPLG